MYPASLLGTGYTDNDLPDFANGLQKNTPPVDAGEYGIVYYGDPNTITFGNQIVYQDNAWKEVIDFAISEANECLFPAFEDSFADTYTVTIPDFDNTEVVVTRDSLCFWSGETEIIPSPLGDIPVFAWATMWYKGGDGDEFGAGLVPNDKWIVLVDATGGGGGGFGIKEGNQNTPIGTYVPELGSNYIVSE